MRRLIEDMAAFVEKQVAVRLSEGGNNRFAFSGPPFAHSVGLFEFFVGQAGALRVETETGSEEISLCLVDPDAKPPQAGSGYYRCPSSKAASLRNSRAIACLLFIHGRELQETFTTTCAPIGIAKGVRDFDTWIKEPLVVHLVEVALRRILKKEPDEQAREMVAECLTEAWEVDEGTLDQPSTWEVLRKLSEADPTLAEPHQVLSAALGVPSCDASDLARKPHMGMIPRIADHLQSLGFEKGFALLEGNAGDELAPALLAFREHLESKGVLDGSEFARSPRRFYSPLGDGVSDLPDWWMRLSVEAWNRILDSDVPQDEGELAVAKIGLLVALPVPRGMPLLVKDRVILEISVGDEEEALEITVQRGSGNSPLAEAARETVGPGGTYRFTDDAVPHHDRFVRYAVSAPGYKTATCKFIVLESYGPGVVAHARGAEKATPFKPVRQGRRNRTIVAYECELDLQGMGSHHLDLYTSSAATLSEEIVGYEIDAEGSSITRPIKCFDENHAACLIETDEECHYVLQVDQRESGDRFDYKVTVNAGEVESTGATTEFDRLVLSHRAAAKSEHSNARVDPLLSAELELQEWSLEDKQSYKPLVLGPDYRENFRKPDWSRLPLLSSRGFPVDPRPAGERFDDAPTGFVSARERVLESLRPVGDDEPTGAISTLRLHEYMNGKEKGFPAALGELLDEYLAWLESDYDTATWSDVIAVHALQPNSTSLENSPYAVLLTPLHPIRLAWQCRAQEVLQEALERNQRCPAASVLNPGSFPDCLMLPCRTATGDTELKPFVSMASSSDYWSVLWCTDKMTRLRQGGDDHVFDPDLGITVEGLSRGFTAQQVGRAMGEISRLRAAKSTLRVAIASGASGSESCSEGIFDWASENLGTENDVWFTGGPRGLSVFDSRAEVNQPEPSVVSSLAERTSGALKWYGLGRSRKENRTSPGQLVDLSIIGHLGTVSDEFATQNLRSAIDASGLTRWRVRRQLHGREGKFIAESRASEIPSGTTPGSLESKLLQCVDVLERQCRESFDSYVFQPNMELLAEVVEGSAYGALSSSNVDVSCFLGATGESYLWDYELPSYARRAGENSGYYLLATASPSILRSVQAAVRLLHGAGDLDNARVSSLLAEVARRGMPTLKGLTSGGSVSLGEIGMLVSLRLLQSEFEDDPRPGTGLLPVKEGKATLNLVVPADPFQNQFEDLRVALSGKKGERPDLLVLSIWFDDDLPSRLRLSAIEVKARDGKLSSRGRESALDQASSFSKFLAELRGKAGELDLWAIAWRSLLASLLDYGFRVYGQLEEFMEEKGWSERHSAALGALANGELEIEIDTRGRLVVIDGSRNSEWVDVDDDGYDETIVVSHADAFRILQGAEGSKLVEDIKSRMGNWELAVHPDPTEDITPLPTETAPAPVSPPPGRPEEDVPGSRDEPGVSQPGTVAASQPEEGEAPGLADAGEPTIPDPVGPVPESTAGDASNVRGIRFHVGTTIREFEQRDLEFYPGNTALNQLNVGVVGDLGTGKTQLIQALVAQLVGDPEMNRGHRPNVLIFDYKRDYMKSGFVEATGARVISPHNIPLNFFDRRDSQNHNPWLHRVKFFSDVLDKIYGGIGHVQRQNLKNAVRAAYKNSEDFERGDPVISDVFEQYKQIVGNRLDSPYSIMSDLIDDETFVSDAAEVIPFSEFLEGVVVVDLAELGQDDRTKNVIVVIFLNLFYEHMLKMEKRPFLGTDPQVRFVNSLLLVDEADNIMRHEFPILKKILKEGREFGVGVLLASQYLSHFKAGHENYLEPLLTWFVHKVPDLTVRELQSIGLTGVDASTVEKIKNLEKHECLYKTLDVNGKLMRGRPFFELVEGKG